MQKRYSFCRCLLMVSVFWLVAFSLRAQDVIVKNDKSEIQAKVLEITDASIKYKQFSFQDGPVYNVNKADVFMIIYQNGNRETFGQKSEQKPVITMQEPVITKSDKKNLPFVKNPTRMMLGFGGYMLGGEPEKAFKGAFEKVRPNNGLISGYGVSTHHFVDMFWIKYTGYTESGSPDGSATSTVETIYGSKHYLSGYVFKEFDTRFISFGALAGPGMNFTRGRYSMQVFDNSAQKYSFPYNDVEANFLTVGLHSGLYLHKYLSTNKKGEKNIFVRLSFEQFLMAKGSYGSVLGLSIGL